MHYSNMLMCSAKISDFVLVRPKHIIAMTLDEAKYCVFFVSNHRFVKINSHLLYVKWSLIRIKWLLKYYYLKKEKKMIEEFFMWKFEIVYVYF